MSADDGRPRTRRLSDIERSLWSRITRSVAPLRQRSAPADPAHPAAPPRTKIKPSPVPRPAVRKAEPPPKPVPQLEPLDRRLRQRLARGTKEIDVRVDLHGKTQSEAHAALLRFLRKAQGDGAKVALVITGKGARGRDDSGKRGVSARCRTGSSCRNSAIT